MSFKTKIIWVPAYLLTLMLSFNTYAETLLHLTYDETNGTTSTIDKINKTIFPIEYSHLLPERVPGVSGNAFRTNGYSTWLTGQFDVTSSNELTVETWIALESFPSTEENQRQESSLLHQKSETKGFNLAINTYGKWWLDININHQNFRIQAPENFPLYHWTHVAFTAKNGLVRLYVNGEIVAERMTVVGDVQLASDSQFILGRAYKPQTSFGVFYVYLKTGKL